MLLPRLIQSSLVTGQILRSLPSLIPLRNGLTCKQLRSISSPSNIHNFRFNSTIASLYPLTGYSHPSSSFSKLWLQQTRGMKTRSSVKRLCDGCRVGNHSSSLSSYSSTLNVCVFSRSEGRTECTSYGMCCSRSLCACLNTHLTLYSSKNPKHKQRQGK